jgi:hypothetical protein
LAVNVIYLFLFNWYFLSDFIYNLHF